MRAGRTYVVMAVTCLFPALGICGSAENSCVEKCQALEPSSRCESHCKHMLREGFRYCRQPDCLKSLECMSVCRITNNIPYNQIEHNKTICMRTLIHPNRRVATEFYWLPGYEVQDFRQLRYASLHIDYIVDYKNHTHKQPKIDEYNISNSKPNVSLLFNIYQTYYSVDYSYMKVTFTVDDKDHNYLLDSWLHLNSPHCSTGLTNKCLDEKFAQLPNVTEYYHFVRTYIVKEPISPVPVNVTCKERQQGVAYNISFRLPVFVTLTEYYNIEPTLSCWCWSSCNITHNLTIRYRVNTTTQDISMVRTTTPEKMTILQYKPEYEYWMISLPVMMEDSQTSKLHLEMSVKSYFEADTYFGPRFAKWSDPKEKLITLPFSFLQHAEIITADDVCRTSPPVNTSDGTPDGTSNGTSNVTSPGKGPSDETPELTPTSPSKSSDIYPVIISVAIILSFAFGITLGFIVYYRKRIPSCIKHTKTPELKKRSQTRLGVGMQSDNDNYHINREDWKDWPLVDRSKIELLKMLGCGQFGEVHMATAENLLPDQGTLQVAVKILRQEASARDEQDFINEGGYLRKFRHPNIVRLLGVCLEKEPKMLVLELMDGGDLLSYLQANKPGPNRLPWDDSEYVDIALDIAAGLKYLEREKFVHRDVAARNCLVSFSPLSGSLPVTKPSSSGRIVKIGDFGLARDIFDFGFYTSRDDKAMLPLRWMAPESLLERVYDGKTDIWSFGILLWEVFTYGEMPYGSSTTVFDVYRFVTMGGTLKQPQFAPNAMFKVMERCWQTNPQRRPTFKELHNLLVTFQKSLTRRKTLMTTLASFASVSGLEDAKADRSGELPNIPAPQFLQVPYNPSIASGNVFDESDLSDVSGAATPDFELDSDNESRNGSVFASTDSISYNSLADRRRRRLEQLNAAACGYSQQTLNNIASGHVVMLPSISIQPPNQQLSPILDSPARTDSISIQPPNQQLSPILGSPAQTDPPKCNETPTHVYLDSANFSESSL